MTTTPVLTLCFDLIAGIWPCWCDLASFYHNYSTSNFCWYLKPCAFHSSINQIANTDLFSVPNQRFFWISKLLYDESCLVRVLSNVPVISLLALSKCGLAFGSSNLRALQFPQCRSLVFSSILQLSKAYHETCIDFSTFQQFNSCYLGLRLWSEQYLFTIPVISKPMIGMLIS